GETSTSTFSTRGPYPKRLRCPARPRLPSIGKPDTNTAGNGPAFGGICMWFTSRGRLGCGRPGSRNHGRRRGSAAVSFFLLAAVAASPAWASAGPPTNDEYALLVLTNESRAEPSADGGTEPVVPPLIWNDALAAAA